METLCDYFSVEYVKSNIRKIKSNSQNRLSNLTFDDELLITVSASVMADLCYIHNHLKQAMYLVGSDEQYYVYSQQEFNFSDKYQIFYGSPQNFIQTIIDLYKIICNQLSEESPQKNVSHNQLPSLLPKLIINHPFELVNNDLFLEDNVKVCFNNNSLFKICLDK